MAEPVLFFTVCVYSVNIRSSFIAPGLGSKALEDGYFQQFYNKAITPDFPGFALVKGPAGSPDEVSAVTGASKSSTAVTNAVNAAVKWYQMRVLRRVQA